MTIVFPPQGNCVIDRNGIALDLIWKAVGDIVVGTGDNSSAILTKGNKYEILTVGETTLEYNTIDGGSA